jgi:hypothetical protein
MKSADTLDTFTIVVYPATIAAACWLRVAGV